MVDLISVALNFVHSYDTRSRRERTLTKWEPVSLHEFFRNIYSQCLVPNPNPSSCFCQVCFNKLVRTGGTLTWEKIWRVQRLHPVFGVQVQFQTIHISYSVFIFPESSSLCPKMIFFEKVKPVRSPRRRRLQGRPTRAPSPPSSSAPTPASTWTGTTTWRR